MTLDTSTDMTQVESVDGFEFGIGKDREGDAVAIGDFLVLLDGVDGDDDDFRTRLLELIDA